MLYLQHVLDKIISIQEAVDKVKDDMTLMIGGFGSTLLKQLKNKKYIMEYPMYQIRTFFNRCLVESDWKKVNE